MTTSATNPIVRVSGVGVKWRLEMEKDKVATDIQKKQMIEEIKKLDKTEMFKPKPKEKKSIISKILMILGYGKKR